MLELGIDVTSSNAIIALGGCAAEGMWEKSRTPSRIQEEPSKYVSRDYRDLHSAKVIENVLLSHLMPGTHFSDYSGDWEMQVTPSGKDSAQRRGLSARSRFFSDHLDEDICFERPPSDAVIGSRDGPPLSRIRRRERRRKEMSIQRAMDALAEMKSRNASQRFSSGDQCARAESALEVLHDTYPQEVRRGITQDE